MEQQDTNTNYQNDFCIDSENTRRKGRIFTGVAFIVGGVLYILNHANLLQLPYWFFSWKMLLILVGLFVGVKHNFRHASWLILVAIGGWGLLTRDIFPELHLGDFFFPAVLILIGLLFIIKPKRRFHPSWHQHFKNRRQFKQQFTDASSEDYIDFNVVFGGIKKNVFSKNFKGGEINNVFGGSEINLTQADFTGTIRLEINNVFGGTKLIIPPHWQIKSEITAVMGSVEDRRTIQPATGVAADKIIILEGNTFFGGIDIRNF
ncbi:MAG: hypothetical protein RL708_2295 [Bacteroidota bacterium]|jgi:predicted membrane protein